MGLKHSHGWRGDPTGDLKTGAQRFYGRSVIVDLSDRTLDHIATSAPSPATPVTMEPVSIPCPCCGQVVGTPSLEIVVQTYGISAFEARILGAVWRGKGRPVQTERIFDAMYADDPDGGPSHTKMYQAFKFGLHRLRDRLTGSGVLIENVGYRRGYRLLLKESAQ